MTTSTPIPTGQTIMAVTTPVPTSAYAVGDVVVIDNGHRRQQGRITAVLAERTEDGYTITYTITPEPSWWAVVSE